MAHVPHNLRWAKDVLPKRKEKTDMDYTHAIDSLKGVLITLGTSIGAVMLVYGGTAYITGKDNEGIIWEERRYCVD